MKVILEFNLPEDIDDWSITKKATEYYLSVEEIRSYIRARLKFDELSEETHGVLLHIRNLLPLED